MHEIPQEFGDFVVLVKVGWKKSNALIFNYMSGLTFLLGGLVVYFISEKSDIHTDYFIAFGAGNFIYIAASDLIPQINKEGALVQNLVHFCAFVAGLMLLYILTFLLDHNDRFWYF